MDESIGHLPIDHIVILTGAGISAESGIKTFRDHNGLWENHPIEKVASPQGFVENPELVQNFYNLRRLQLKDVEPNKAHQAIADFQKDSKSKVTIITQNVDDLHERAGSENIIHIHGELRKIRHLETGEIKYFEGKIEKYNQSLWRPHIVWFGEQILNSYEIREALNSATLFLSIGTSGQVYPAAGFVNQLHSLGIPCIELNQEKTSDLFEHSFLGDATASVPTFFSQLRHQ